MEAVVRNTFVQGTLSIVFVVLAIVVIVASVLVTAKALRDGGGANHEDPPVASRRFAPADLFATKAEKAIQKEWAALPPRSALPRRGTGDGAAGDAGSRHDGPRDRRGGLRTAGARVHDGAARVRWYVRQVMGDDAYATYAAHQRAVHPGGGVATEREFWRMRHAEQDANPGSRCC